MKKVTSTLVALILLSFSLQSQINGSFKVGLSSYQGDLHCRSDENIKLMDESNLSLGVGIRLPLSEILGFRAEATYFQLTADETQFTDESGHAKRGWGFNNKFLEITALVDWEILGKKGGFNDAGKFKRTLTPVIFGGLGLAFNSPTVNWKSTTSTEITEDENDVSNVAITLPIGLGLKYYISSRFALSLEAGYRLPISDYYDGVSQAANPDKNDSFGFGGVKAYFALGRKATDNSNVKN